MKTRRELFSASTVLGSLLLVLSMTTGAQAQTLYRCGNSYQDKPCDKGQKEQILGKLATTDNTNKPVVDASCRLRGEDAKKIIWMREAGATQERVLSEAGTEERKKLINEIYAQRGNAADVRAAVEKECMDEKQRAMNAANLQHQRHQRRPRHLLPTKKPHLQVRPTMAKRRVKKRCAIRCVKRWSACVRQAMRATPTRI
jgi:hypothetical protein